MSSQSLPTASSLPYSQSVSSGWVIQSAQADRGVSAVLTPPQIKEYVSIMKNHNISIQQKKEAKLQQAMMVEVHLWTKVSCCFSSFLFVFFVFALVD